MAKKIVEEITLFKDGTYDFSRGPDCDDATRKSGKKKDKKKKPAKKKSSPG